MDNRVNLKNHFETLELELDATVSEINEAYTSLKKLYSSNSIAISPLIDEFTEEKSKKILREIDIAYKSLSAQSTNKELSSKSECTNKITPEDNKTLEGEFGGSMLMHARLSKKIEFKEIADNTNISKRYLLNIENENFEELPARIYLKGFIVSYAKYLGLDAEKIANAIIERFEIWQQPEKDDKLK